MNPALLDTLRQTGWAACLLGGFAMLGGAMVSLTHLSTREIIHNNQQQALQSLLAELVPPQYHDKPLTQSPVDIHHPPLQDADHPITVYRAYRDGQPVALVATPVARDGYSGPIHLLVATWADGRLAGVRVLQHHETPGLGDAIDLSRSDWIESFRHRALGDPPLAQWAVRRDGGVFDQFSGATITPRAVVRAVRQWLIYESAHRDRLYHQAGSPS